MKKLIITVIFVLATFSSSANTSYLFRDLKFPKVAFGIYRLETANGTSKLCKQYHNLFGFKINKRKIYIGTTKNKYCIYSNKMDSVRDYYLWEKGFIRKHKITSQNQFIAHLVKRYASDVNYKKKLLKIMKNV